MSVSWAEAVSIELVSASRTRVYLVQFKIAVGLSISSESSARICLFWRCDSTDESVRSYPFVCDLVSVCKLSLNQLFDRIAIAE